MNDTEMERKVVSLRASGMTWTKIGREIGMCRTVFYEWLANHAELKAEAELELSLAKAKPSTAAPLTREQTVRILSGLVADPDMKATERVAAARLMSDIQSDQEWHVDESKVPITTLRFRMSGSECDACKTDWGDSCPVCHTSWEHSCPICHGSFDPKQQGHVVKVSSSESSESSESSSPSSSSSSSSHKPPPPAPPRSSGRAPLTVAIDEYEDGDGWVPVGETGRTHLGTLGPDGFRPDNL